MRSIQTPFNSPLEAGLRAVCLLQAAYPQSFDLQKITALDYLIVHTGDVYGPKSLHPKLPFRSGEILVRRGIIENGLLLMISRGLVDRKICDNGIEYQAGDFSKTFMESLSSQYTQEMIARGKWVVEKYAKVDETLLRNTMNQVFGQWAEEFQAIQSPNRFFL